MSLTVSREYVGYELALPGAALLVTIIGMATAMIVGVHGWTLLLLGGLAGGVALSGST